MADIGRETGKIPSRWRAEYVLLLPVLFMLETCTRVASFWRSGMLYIGYA